MSRRLAGMLVCLLGIMLGLCIIAPDVLAAPPEPGSCTNDPGFDVPYNLLDPGSGLISTIVTNIQAILGGVTFMVYNSLLDTSSGLTGILSIALTIYIAIYGIFFTFGMVQVTLYDFFTRMVKIGLIVMLVSGAYLLEAHYFLFRISQFFTDGTNSIIAAATQAAVGGTATPYDPDYPFIVLDSVITKAVSAKMAVTILATFFTGPYGVVIGVMLIMALGSFLKALFTAVWVFLMALVLRTLLLALSPIFIGCILFSRTRHIFDGWLNQLVNTCLQPILMFVFFAFFAKLIEGAIDNILVNPVCWTQLTETVRGTSTEVNYWRFAIESSPGSNIWSPYSGRWNWGGPDNVPNAPIFPIDILHILIFLILAELASRFNHVVLEIARELAGAGTNLGSMQGQFSQWFSPASGRQNNLAASLPSSGPGVTGRTAADTRDRISPMSSIRRSG